MALITVLAWVWAALTEDCWERMPRPTMAVSGTTVTLPTPETSKRLCFWETTEEMGIAGPKRKNK